MIAGVAAIVNVCALDVPPPGLGFTTVIDAVPEVATKEAGTVAVSCVEETKLVARDAPFQFTVEVETNLVPFTVKVKSALPAVVQVGLIEVVVGTGLLIVRVSAALPVPPALVALMVTLYIPAVVGVPEIKPVLVFTDRPAGSRPVTLKLVGLLVAVIVYENATPTWPVAVRGLVMTGAGGLMVKVNVALPVPPELVALIVTVYVPAVVGVPEIMPVLVSTVKPAGSPVALKLVGLLVAVIW